MLKVKNYTQITQTLKETEPYNKVFITNKPPPLSIRYRSFNKTLHKSSKEEKQPVKMKRKKKPSIVVKTIKV